MITRRLLALGLLLAANVANAQNLRVIPVPWVATDPAVPHAAYNGHATTFKAIARGGNGTYLVEWDFQGDGVYDYSASTTNRYDLSTRFTYPNQATAMTFSAKVRVTSNGQTVTGTYPVRVFPEVPADPNNATDRQLQVMRNVAIDDGLWFLHRAMVRSGNEEDPLTGAQVTGFIELSSMRTTASAPFLEALGANEHFAAFPAAYLGALPDPAANTARWNNDPYAEDAARLVNYLLSQAVPYTITATDESNAAGFYPETMRDPILGTDDAIGLWIGESTGDQWTRPQATALRAIAHANLTGYVAQVGDANRVLGRRFEFIAQQLVDALVWAQNDGSYLGSWYFSPNGSNDLLDEFGQGTLTSAEALFEADRSLAGAGVIVPNLAKARLASYIMLNGRACPSGGFGGAYNNSTPATYCDIASTAAHVLSLGWSGANAFSTTDARLAFPSYGAVTRGQLRTRYDATLTFVTNAFLAITPTSINWDNGFIEGGDFGRLDGRGDLWTMLHWTRAARAVTPELNFFGPNNHARQFARYLVNHQATDGGWSWTYSASLLSHNDDLLGATVRAAMAILILSRDGLVPVATATASVSTAPEGTPITFNGGSFAGGDATYSWSFGNGATAEGQQVTYAYPDNGNYSVALTVSTDGGISAHILPVTITNVAPVANAGPDRTVDPGSSVSFAGSFTDPGTADTFTYSWNFGDGSTSNAQNTAHAYAAKGVFTVTFRVTDDDGGTSTDVAVVTVRNAAPTITSTPPATYTDGVPFSYTLTFTDPDAADTHTCSAPVKPAGAVLAACTVTWSPTFAELFTSPDFTLCVADSDGATTCQPFTLAIVPADTDSDGLPDGWEVFYFGAISGQSGATDSDGDGLTNADELLLGTDPTAWDGPGAPVLLAPAAGSRMATAQPVLLVANATHPLGRPLAYDFAVYSDAAATQLVASAAAVPAGSGFTAWPVDVALAEDGTYYWRARAVEGTAHGAWSSETWAFTVDVVPLPGTPGPTGTTGDTGATGQPGPAGPKGAAGCSCGSTSATPWPVLMVGLGFAIRPRRRKTA